MNRINLPHLMSASKACRSRLLPWSLAAVLFAGGAGGASAQAVSDGLARRALPALPDPPGAPATDASGFEVPPVVAAADLLPADALAGPHHRVRPGAVTDGYLAHFTIDSDFGTFDCAGRQKALQRIHEVGALAELSALSKSDVFVDALKQSAQKPVEAVKQIADDPKAAVKQLPKSVGHFFKRAGTAIAAGAERLGDAISDGGADGAAAAQAAEDAGKGAIGYNRALLQVARDVGVDPYTDNQPLKDKAEEIAWVFFAGGSPINLGVGIVSGGASIALKTTVAAGLPSEVYELTPSEVLVRNQEAMTAAGTDAALQERFVRNPVLTPSVRLSLLDSLGEIGVQDGYTDVVELAAGLTAQGQAEFLARALSLLAEARRTGRATFTGLEVYGRLPAARDAIGATWVAAPVDYVSWTAEVAAFAGRDDLGGTGRVLAHRGATFTGRARQELAKAGWQLEGFGARP